jgi:flavin-dependent dehydrogenase
LLKGRGTPSEIFEDELVQCPALIERLMNAELVSEFRVAKEFSYTTKQHAGDGWVLIGDAFGFIDPIYSSGVYFAMKSGELAADAVIEAIRSGDTSGSQLGKWTDEFTSGTRWIRKLVEAFYTNEFSFGRFLREHPRHVGNLTDLLIGRIFCDGAGRIFDDLDPARAAAIAAQQPMT